MAKVDNKGMVRGTAGSVVYRQYRGMNIIQGKPRKCKQTLKSISASTEFGLSSSTAAVIREAFRPAYVHRDGEAVSRTTQIVYRSIRGSAIAEVGKRDLHDANLHFMPGMEFNNNSKVSDVLQFSWHVEKDQQNKISVLLGAFDVRKDLRLPRSIREAASFYRLRFSLVAFNFRKEYYEHLEVKDLDLRRTSVFEEQRLCFERTAEPDQLLLLSISLLAFSETRMDEGYILLNSKEFSPSALVAAFEAADPGEFPAGPAEIEVVETRMQSISGMGYVGNRLLKDLEKRTKKMPQQIEYSTKRRKMEIPVMQTGRRISFQKR